MEPTVTVYRAKLTTAVLTMQKVTAIIESIIVSRGVLMDNTAMNVVINKTCPVVITSFSDPVCDLTTDAAVNTEEESKKNGVVIAVASIAAFIALVALVIVLVLLVLVYRRHKRRYVKICKVCLHCDQCTACC